MDTKQHTEEQVDDLQLVIDMLRNDDTESVKQHIAELHPAEIAHLLESMPADQRMHLWEHLPHELDGEILTNLNDDVRTTIIHKMQPKELVAATESLDTDDLADILPEMPADAVQELLLTMEQSERERLRSVLSYDEDTAGGLMDLEIIPIRADIQLDVVLRYLRRQEEIPPSTDKLFVIDREGHYLGNLPLTTLLISDTQMQVQDLMQTKEEAIPAETPEREVASRFEKRDLISAPVVDINGILIGRITIDDVVDVIRDDAEHSMMSMAGLREEEDMFAPIILSAKRRALWLGISLVSALMAASVIHIFESTIEKIIALAVLMPIVASMGGIAGSQTLTLVIRGIALGQLSGSNARQLLAKELWVSGLNGLLWAFVLGFIAWLWFNDIKLSIVIGSAIIVNLLVSAVAGATIPLILRKIGADPALGGSVVLITITDVMGFFTFLGLATFFLL